MVAWPPHFPHHNLSGLYQLLRLHVPHAVLFPQLHLRTLSAFLSSFGSTLEVLKVPPFRLSSFTGMDPNWGCRLQRRPAVPPGTRSSARTASAGPAGHWHRQHLRLSDFVSKLPLHYRSSFALRTQITAQQLHDSIRALRTSPPF